MQSILECRAAKWSGALGEDGQRVYDDRLIKTSGGHYRSGDVTYKWDPDSKGRSIYLVFRENILVNYNPDDFTNEVDNWTE